MADTTKTPAARTSTLPKAIFDVEISNHELLKLAYDSYLAGARTSAARTKTRGDVSGGGKKPWKQKGTGRARFGSSRNPIWRGGGIAFGPTGNENYRKRLSVAQKRQAIRQALSLANKAGVIATVDAFAPKEGKVKETLALFGAQKITPEQRVLLVVSVKDDLVRRATRNIQQVKVSQAMYLNVFDILNADRILISKDALTMVEEWLTQSKETK